jgi:hypothetical protein
VLADRYGRGRAAQALATSWVIATVVLSANVAHAASGTGHRVPPEIRVAPTSGPTGTTVSIRGRGFPPIAGCYLGYWVDLSFDDATHQQLLAVLEPLSAQGTFTASWTVPSTAAVGPGRFTATEFIRFGSICIPGPTDSTRFTVTTGLRATSGASN